MASAALSSSAAVLRSTASLSAANKPNVRVVAAPAAPSSARVSFGARKHVAARRIACRMSADSAATPSPEPAPAAAADKKEDLPVVLGRSHLI